MLLFVKLIHLPPGSIINRQGICMQWFMLLLAGVAEVTWATTMKMSAGFSKIIPSIVTAVFYIASAVFLALALKKLPLGTAYAMWTGFGLIGTAVIGVLLFKESLSAANIICLCMIVLGIIGLKVL